MRPLTAADFVAIAPGTFLMGDFGEPQLVTLTRSFFIQKTPVTQRQWQALMRNNPSCFQKCAYCSSAMTLCRCGDCPVEQVSWFDAIGFANAMSREEGLPEVYNDDGSLKTGADIYATTGYRLPTEAEWECAYRAGTKTRRYNGDDDSNVGEMHYDDEIVRYYDNRTHPVTQKQPNACGLYDMVGNVWEWTNDWSDDYPGGAFTDYAGPESGLARVIRGGSWPIVASPTRSAFRFCQYPDGRVNFIGFRLARSRRRNQPSTRR